MKPKTKTARQAVKLPKSVEAPKPKKRGGPSQYDPAYCAALAEHSQKLYGTLTLFAAKLGVHMDTLENWALKYPEFREAKMIAKTRQEAVMERIGIKGMIGKHESFHAAPWIFYMKARFGWNDAGPNDQDQSDLEFDFE